MFIIIWKETVLWVFTVKKKTCVLFYANTFKLVHTFQQSFTKSGDSDNFRAMALFKVAQTNAPRPTLPNFKQSWEFFMTKKHIENVGLLTLFTPADAHGSSNYFGVMLWICLVGTQKCLVSVYISADDFDRFASPFYKPIRCYLLCDVRVTAMNIHVTLSFPRSVSHFSKQSCFDLRFWLLP